MNLLRSKASRGTRDRTQKFLSNFLRGYDSLAPRPSAHFKRNALLALGRQLINTHVYTHEGDDGFRRCALEAGLACLRAAGESDESCTVQALDYSSLFAIANTVIIKNLSISNAL